MEVKQQDGEVEEEEIAKDPRAGAIIVQGNVECRDRAIELLVANGLPGGLLPLEDIEEVGYVEATGYFWVQQKKPKQHYFPLIGKTCHYEGVITGRFEKGCIRDLTGITSKEALFLWFTIAHIFTNPEKHPGEIYFKAQSGLGKWLSAEAFALPDPQAT